MKVKGVVVTSPAEKDLMKEIMEYVQSFVVAGILAAFIILFIAQSFVVNGESMEPTLHNGERLLVEKLSYRFGEPHRGDIVVLNTKTKEKYIKRVIGIPGDTLVVKDGQTYVNDHKVNDEFTLEPTMGSWGPYKVPAGNYFVMGDNRNHSDDSRLSVGFLPKKKIVGRAFVRYFPLNKMEVFHRPKMF